MGNKPPPYRHKPTSSRARLLTEVMSFPRIYIDSVTATQSRTVAPTHRTQSIDSELSQRVWAVAIDAIPATSHRGPCGGPIAAIE